MTSFNDGREAAVTTDEARRFLECAVRNWSRVNFNRDGLEDFRIELERFRQKVLAEALKRPGPSEAEKVERVAAYVMGQCDPVWAQDEWQSAPEPLKDYYRDVARAALAATGGEA